MYLPCDSVISGSSSVRNIGAVLDSGLSMDEQIKNICRSCNISLRSLSKIRSCLTEDSATTLTHAFIVFLGVMWLHNTAFTGNCGCWFSHNDTKGSLLCTLYDDPQVMLEHCILIHQNKLQLFIHKR